MTRWFCSHKGKTSALIIYLINLGQKKRKQKDARNRKMKEPSGGAGWLYAATFRLAVVITYLVTALDFTDKTDSG